MNLLEDESLLSIRTALLDGMREFMAESDVGYSEDDVRQCGEILEQHLLAISAAETVSSAQQHVKETVQRLNSLNEEAGSDLIETDQREKICEIIIRAGAIRGFNSESEDITEEWREW